MIKIQFAQNIARWKGMKTFAMLVFVCIISVALLPVKLSAQKKSPDKAVAHLYQTDYDAVDDKIFREHIQLNGDSVDYIPFRKDKLYGFVDKKTKKWVIEPQYSQVFACYKEGAIVEMPGKKGYADGYGLVDYTGKFLIAPAFQNLFKEGHVYHGMLDASDTSMADQYSGSTANYYYNEQGKFIFSTNAHRFKTFVGTDTLAWFRYGEKYSIYSKSGKLVKTFLYQSQYHFCGIYDNILVQALERKDGRALYTGTDITGKKKFELTYDRGMNEVYQLSDSVFAFIGESSFELVNAKGEALPYGMQSEWPSPGFSGSFPYLKEMDLMPVQNQETGKTGYINSKGKLVIPCKYSYAGYFNQGEAPYLDTAKHAIGFMNAAGETTVPPVILMETARQLAMENQSLRFSEGLCKVIAYVPKKDEKGEEFLESDDNGRVRHNIAYINRSGERQLLLPDSIILGGDFSDGLAAVVGKAGGLGFMDTTGKLVIPMKYEIAVAGAYPVPYLVIPMFKNGFVYLKSFKGYLDKSGYEYFSGKQEKDHYDFSH